MSGDAQSAWVEVLEHGKAPWNSEFLTVDIVIRPANHVAFCGSSCTRESRIMPTLAGFSKGGRREKRAQRFP